MATTVAMVGVVVGDAMATTGAEVETTGTVAADTAGDSTGEACIGLFADPVAAANAPAVASAWEPGDDFGYSAWTSPFDATLVAS